MPRFVTGALVSILITAICGSGLACARFPMPSSHFFHSEESYDPDAPLPPIDDWLVGSRVPLKIARTGVLMETVYAPVGISTPPMAMRVRNGDDYFALLSLSELKGLVHISSEADAMRFVRLRTLTRFAYCWPKEIHEIVTEQEVKKPEFTGFGDESGTVEAGCDGDGRSGAWAVLSKKAYREGKFEPATARKLGNVYEITRWVCVFAELSGSRVQKWRESVGEDGKYSHTILLDRPVPKLPGTDWYIMGRA